MGVPCRTVPRQTAELASSPEVDLMLPDVPVLDLGAMDLSGPPLPPLSHAPPSAQQQWGSAPASTAEWHHSPLQPAGPPQQGRRATSSPVSPDLLQQQQGQHGQLDMRQHAKLEPLPGWQPVRLQSLTTGVSAGCTSRSAPPTRPPPLPAGLSSALRSQSISDSGNSLGPSVWLSANGTASGSPPVRSYSWGVPPMSSIPEAGGQPQRQQPHQQQACSIPLPGPGRGPQQQGMGWVTVPQTVGEVGGAHAHA